MELVAAGGDGCAQCGADEDSIDNGMCMECGHEQPGNIADKTAAVTPMCHRCGPAPLWANIETFELWTRGIPQWIASGMASLSHRN